MIHCLYIQNCIKSINKGSFFESTTFDSLEKQETILSDIKIYVMICLIGHIWSEVSADKCVPVSIVLSVQFILKMGGYLLDCMHLFKSVLSYSDYLSLHFWAYTFVLDNWSWLFSLCHKFQIKLYKKALLFI